MILGLKKMQIVEKLSKFVPSDYFSSKAWFSKRLQKVELHISYFWKKIFFISKKFPFQQYNMIHMIANDLNLLSYKSMVFNHI